jgi:hypothetical protein
MATMTVPVGQYADRITEETIQLVQQRLQTATVQRNINTTTGLLGYDLQGPAAVVVPVDTPLVNGVPRKNNADRASDRHHWKAIQTFGWNTVNGANFPGVLDQNAIAPDLPYTVIDMYNAFQSIATDQSITVQEVIRGQLLEGDVKARRFAELIYALKITEENWLTHSSDYLWSPAAPLQPTSAGTGGTITDGTYYVFVSATIGTLETFATQAQATVVCNSSGANTCTISCTYFTVPNATGYNVYVGTSATAARKQVAANFSVPSGVLPTQSMLNMNGSASFTLTSLTTGANQLPTSNSAVLYASNAAYNSQPLTFNGIMALIFGAGNQYYTGGTTPGQSAFPTPTANFTAAGTSAAKASVSGGLGVQTMGTTVLQPAAANGKLSYSDITTLLLIMYNQARAKPDKMWCSPQDNQTVTNLLINAGGTRVMINPTKDDLGNITAGGRVGKFWNPTTNTAVDIETLPFLPQGTILFGSTVMPYPMPGFEGPTMQVMVNRDYMGMDFPPTRNAPVYGYQTLVDETLKLTFIGGFSAITGIVPGTN